MKIKIIVSSKNAPGRIDEFSFDQPEISIGRESSNILTLPDPNKIVGRRHARISLQGNSYFLEDLGSKNFTFLNNNRLEAGQPYPLNNGDLVTIGEFTLQFVLHSPEVEESDRTVFSDDFINPFLEDARELGNLLKRISENYLTVPQTRRDSALAEAFGDALQPAEVNFLLNWLPQPHQDEDGGSAAASPAHSVSAFSESQTAGISARDFPGRVVDLLLEIIVKMIKVPWQFRLEFLGQTIIQSENEFSFHTGTAEQIKQYILAPEISPEEHRKRLDGLKQVSNEAMIHQIALLEGYKRGVDEGTRKLLGDFNPRKPADAEKPEKGLSSFLLKIFPFLRDRKLLETLEDKYRELLAEDLGIVEKKFFRPGFIKGYASKISHKS